MFVAQRARLWAMDIILVCDPLSTFDEGNGLSGSWAYPKQRHCIEFGLGANNAAYDGALFETSLGWVIRLKYNSIDKKWLVSKTPNQ